MDMLKGGYGLYKTGTGIRNSMTAEDAQDARVADYYDRRNNMTTARPDISYDWMPNRELQSGTAGPQASAPRNWIDQLLGIGGGVYSDIQNREAFTNLNDLFSRREQARAPLEQALTQSYADGGKSFLAGDAYQAQARLEQNKLDRGAAKVGRNANDIDRDVLMQAHALKSLGDYRSGLTNTLGQMQLPYDIFSQAQNRNARAGGATAGGIGYSGATGGIIELLKQAGIDPSKVAGSLPQIIRAIGGGSGGVDIPSDPGDGPSGFGYGDFDMPTDTGDNYYGIDFDDPSVWEDTSWMNGIDGWFDI